MMKSKRLVSLAVLLLVGLMLAWMYYPTFLFSSPPLAFKVEGLIDSKINFRDAGASINACASDQLLPEARILRSSGFFSGWSCDKVGNPDMIYSLNYSDEEHRAYYCRGANDRPFGFNIGVSFQAKEISDIEFLSTWEEGSEQVKSVCMFISESLRQIRDGKKILIHCDAGRDRTGAVVALIAAYELEARGPLSDAAISALECDYRKSRSLRAEKYGRIQALLERLRADGGVRRFLHERCAQWPSDI
jgi:hypothetical protein